MRAIRKGPEPWALKQHRASEHASYGNLTADALAVIRQSLAGEQQYLCCYCMGRIDPTPDASGQVRGMKIEHWLSQSDSDEGKDHALDYRNMLGACPGNQGSPPALQHCDTRKGSHPITLDPREPSPHPRRLRYALSGAIEIDDASLQANIKERLNLNAEHLKANRKQALDRFVQEVRQKLGNERAWTTAKLQQFADRLRQPDGQGRLLQHVEVMLFWLRKRDGAVT